MSQVPALNSTPRFVLNVYPGDSLRASIRQYNNTRIKAYVCLDTEVFGMLIEFDEGAVLTRWNWILFRGGGSAEL